MLLLCAILLVPAVAGIPDPCASGNHAEINEPKRSAGYVMGPTDAALCDSDLPQGWYRFTSLAGHKMPEHCVGKFHCGTHAPIWLNGTHPTVQEGMVDRVVCANFGGNGRHPELSCCDTYQHVGVKNCGTFFVYYLMPTNACPVAYCAGEHTPCPDGQFSSTGYTPCIEAPTTPPKLEGPEIVGKTFRFTCNTDFTHTDPEVALEVAWTFDGQEDITVPHSVLGGSQTSAVLPGTSLKDHLGTEVGCKIRAFSLVNLNVTTNWTESNTYWAGIRTTPQVLTVEEKGGEQNITLTSTIPLVCDHDKECCLTFMLDVNGPRDNLMVPTSCQYSLCSGDWDAAKHEASITIPVAANKDHIADGNKTMQVNFQKVLSAAGGPYLATFDGHRVQPVKVVAMDTATAKCSWSGDPHIHVMENRRSYNLFDIGDFTMYENIHRNFEVQARTWPCGGRRHRVTCVCGVAIREGNDVIRISQCEQQYGARHTSPVIQASRQLNRTGTAIHRSTDGRRITVNLPSGFAMSIHASSSHMDTQVMVPSVDHGAARGICGTFDNNGNNEVTHRGGQVETRPSRQPTRFTDSWRNNRTSSLFETTPPSIPDDPKAGYCSCDASGSGTPAVDCSGNPNAVKNQRVQCQGSCRDVTSNVPAFLQGNGWAKRSADGAVYADVDEMDPPFNPDPLPVDGEEAQWPTESGITEHQAKQHCRQNLHSSQLWSRCHEDLDLVEKNVEDCAQDILNSDSYDFMEAALSAFTAECHLDLTNDPNNYVTSPDGRNVLQEALSSHMCSDDCLRHGRCVQGACVCESGYAGDNCQLEAGKGPVLDRLRGSDLCDVTQRPCRKVFFDASNFQMSDHFHCAVQEIRADGSLSSDRHTEEAELLSSGRLACPLPDLHVGQDRSMVTVAISVTSDGVLYSNHINISIYDASCRDCSQNGCPQKPNTCLINDVCHLDHDVNPASANQMCQPQHSATQWTMLHIATPAISKPFAVVVDAQTLRCSFDSADHNPSSRYRVQWRVDGQIVEGGVHTSGNPGADIRVADLPSPGRTVPVQCLVSPFLVGEVPSGQFQESYTFYAFL